MIKKKMSMTDISDLSILLLLYHKKRRTVNEKSMIFIYFSHKKGNPAAFWDPSDFLE